MGVLWLVSLVLLSQLSRASTETAVGMAAKDNRTAVASPGPGGGERAKRGLEEGEEADLAEKREGPRARFSSWAGKRSDLIEPSDKRAKFSSWGGKRSKFSSWGGKRDYQDEPLGGELSSEEKRGKFNSWAGKRGKFSSWAGKRGKFNSWAGKRSDGGDDSFEEDKRAKFSSWAGKRAPDYIGSAWSRMTPDARLKYYNGPNMMKLWQDLMSRKRARFSSWAGKRSDEEVEEKRKFSSWGGKRDDDEGAEAASEQDYPGTIVKRSVFWNPSYKRKPVFSSWGGKRSSSPAQHSIQERSVPGQRSLLFLRSSQARPWGSLMRPIRKQPEFYAWGGKRSV